MNVVNVHLDQMFWRLVDLWADLASKRGELWELWRAIKLNKELCKTLSCSITKDGAALGSPPLKNSGRRSKPDCPHFRDLSVNTSGQKQCCGERAFPIKNVGHANGEADIRDGMILMQLT